jgi:3-deoxy-D-manno-octulosonic-acid transferase
VTLAPDPGSSAAELARAFDHWRPTVLVLVGTPFRPAVVALARQRGVPVLGLALRGATRNWMQRRFARGMARRHLAQFHRLMCEDAVTRRALVKIGAPRDRTEVSGLLARDVRVLPSNEAERESLSELLSSRPVWCAAALPMTELPVILAAHRLASQRSHRLLLVVVPADPADGPAMRDVIAAEGWVVGLRSEGEDPTDDIPVYVTDLSGELGLWLRLAPIAWIGGTIDGTPDARSPMEAAALGSAILHGPAPGVHRTDYARLDAAGAARQVQSADEIAAAVETLLAPDQAAAMAHAAWEVSSAGEDAAARAVEMVQALLAGDAG